MSSFENCEQASLQHYVIQNHKKQDMVRTGSYNTTNNMSHCNSWMVVADGHGVGNVINVLNTLDWNDVMNNDEPIEYVKTLINSMEQTIRDGSTISIVKISNIGIRMWWIGDSQIRVYKNDEELWRSNNHNGENLKELQKTREKNLETELAWELSVLDNEHITLKPSNYIYHIVDGQKEKLALTRSLGHNGDVCQETETHFIPFDNKSKWKIIAASDGFWDMMCLYDNSFLKDNDYGAEELCKIASQRWSKKWFYVDPRDRDNTKIVKQQIQGSHDDIGVAVWSGNM